MVGRYLILEQVPQAGADEAYWAYDPQLQRRVALKLFGRDGLTLKQAQAMGQVSHPNVVSVYDAGLVSEQIFVAMELLEGQTLLAWLTDLIGSSEGGGKRSCSG